MGVRPATLRAYSWHYIQGSLLVGLGIIWVAGDQTQASLLQRKHPTHCTILSSPLIIFKAKSQVEITEGPEGIPAFPGYILYITYLLSPSLPRA